MLNSLAGSFSPNRVVPKNTTRLIICFQIALFFIYWQFFSKDLLPKPMEVVNAYAQLWEDGLVGDLIKSLFLFLQALTAATAIALTISYAAALPFFRPFAEFWSKFRFLGMVGMPFVFTIYFHGAHMPKLSMLIFFITVFMVTSMIDILDGIPKEKYDLARTLRMNEWQVIWEVQILGRADFAFDMVRQNAAIGWMMLASVEAIWKFEGGIGAKLSIEDHQFGLEQIAAMQLLILGVGLLQDYGLGKLKDLCCPYAKLLLERK